MVKMQNQFKFNINNFGPINEAHLDLNKLTIVGGVNGSGKSFSSRLLFCIITALSDEGKKIDNDAIKNLFEDFIKRYDLNFSPLSAGKKISSQIQDLMNSWNEYDVSYNYLNDIYFKFIEILKNEELINDNLDNDLNKITGYRFT